MSGNTILIIGIILAGLSALVSILGTIRKDNETKTELNTAHANFTNNLKEAYGIISNRTVEEFCLEKIPNNISVDEGMELLDKAVNKWLQNEINEKYHYRVAKNDTSEYWSFEKFDDESKQFIRQDYLKLYRNFPVAAHNVKTFYDLHIRNDDSPAGIENTYIHVLLNTGNTKKGYQNFADFFQVKNLELFYTYCHWYDLFRSSRLTTHRQDKHIIIFVVDDWKKQPLIDEIKSELEMWMEIDGEKPPLFRPYELLIYEKKALNNIKLQV